LARALRLKERERKKDHLAYVELSSNVFRARVRDKYASARYFAL